MMQHDLEQKIRVRAYELWEQDGCVSGRDEEYWRRAEIDVRASLGAAANQLSVGAPIEAPAAEAPAKKTRTRRAAAQLEEAAPVPPAASKRRRSSAARVTSH
jgi:hypothetical protein